MECESKRADWRRCDNCLWKNELTFSRVLAQHGVVLSLHVLALTALPEQRSLKAAYKRQGLIGVTVPRLEVMVAEWEA